MEIDLEQFLLMSEEDIAGQLNAIAAHYSNETTNVTITENDVWFEKKIPENFPKKLEKVVDTKKHLC